MAPSVPRLDAAAVAKVVFAARLMTGLAAMIDRMRTSSALLLACLLVSPTVPAQILLPDLGDSAQAGFTSSDEARAGRDGFRWLRENNALLGDAELDDYLRRMSVRLANSSPDPAQHYRLFAIDDNQINAFAMPGGYIGIHTGLIVAAQNESELASVMAHEMAHVTQHHIARQMEQRGLGNLMALGGMLAAVLAASAGGGANAAIAAATAGPGLAIQNQLSFSRDFEREADRVGIQTLGKAGFDSRAMGSFFERLQKTNRINDNNALAFLRTHPVTSERVSDAENRAASQPARMPADSVEFLLAREKSRVAVMEPLAAARFYRDAIRDRRYVSEMAQWYGLSAALLAQNDIAGAREANRRAAALAGQPNPWLIGQEAAIELAARNYDVAARLYHDGRARFPDAPALAYGEIDSLIAGKRLDPARDLAEREVTRRPDSAVLWQRLARIYADRDVMRYHFALGQQFYYEGNYRAALEQYRFARDARGDDFYVRSRIDARVDELTPIVKEEKNERR